MQTPATVRPKRTPRLYHEGLWIALGQVATVLGTVIGVRVLTELLDPAAYGQLSLAMTVAMLVNQWGFGPLSEGAARLYAAACTSGELHSLLLAIRRMVWMFTGITLLAAFLIGCGLVWLGLTKWIVLGGMALLFALLCGYDLILSGLQNAARQRAIVALHRGMSAWGRFLLAAGLIYWLTPTSTISMTGYCLTMILVLLSQLLFFKRTIFQADTTPNPTHQNTIRNWQAQLWHYSWPFATWATFTAIHQTTDRWAVELFHSTHDVGLYVVLMQLGATPIAMATSLVAQLAAPILFQWAGTTTDSQRMEQAYTLNNYLVLLALGLTVVAFGVAWAFHDLLFRLLAAPHYASISYLLPWVVLGGGLFATGQMLAIHFMSRMQTNALIKPKIVTSVLGIGFNFVGTYYLGILGTVLAGVAFSSIYCVWIAIIARQKR